MRKRIKLDWSLSTAQEREAFVEKYITQEQFKSDPLTPTELSHISDYLLFGKDEDGLNGTQKKLYDIETKSTSWRKKKNVSLDAILEEHPNFSFESTPTFQRREVFDREQAKAESSPDELRAYQEIWKLIDRLDWQICFWELANGKRTKPIRPSLDIRFGEEERAKLSHETESWDNTLWLKKRHLLVELRKEQYWLRETFGHSPGVFGKEAKKKRRTFVLTEEDTVLVGASPLGFSNEDNALGADASAAHQGKAEGSSKDHSSAPAQNSVMSKAERASSGTSHGEFSSAPANLVFLPFREWGAHRWSLEEREILERRLKEAREDDAIFDFTREEHLRALVETRNDLALEEQWRALVGTFDFYCGQANLTDIQRFVLEARLEGKKNFDIANAVNEKFGKRCSENYVSTILNQGAIKKICETAKVHEKMAELVVERGNGAFKKCGCCGKRLPAMPEFFLRRKSAPSGLNGRCKECDRERRKARKETQGEK